MSQVGLRRCKRLLSLSASGGPGFVASRGPLLLAQPWMKSSTCSVRRIVLSFFLPFLARAPLLCRLRFAETQPVEMVILSQRQLT